MLTTNLYEHVERASPVIYVTGIPRSVPLLSMLLVVVLLVVVLFQLNVFQTAPTSSQQLLTQPPYASSDWMDWGKTAWTYFLPGIGVNSASGLHMSNLDFPCFTDWDLGGYIMSIIAASRLGLIQMPGTWGFNYRIQAVLIFLLKRPVLQTPYPNTPYQFYSSINSTGYQRCTLLPPSYTNAADEGRLLDALHLVETYARNPTFNNDATIIIARSAAMYNNFGNTCCNVADYYPYLMGEGYRAFGYNVSVFSAINSYTGPFYSLNGQSLPEINTVAEPFNLEILTGQPSPRFLDFAKRVYMAQQAQWNETGLLTAWTEGAYAPQPAYIYEWILVNLNGVWRSWQLTGTNYAQEGATGGPPADSPVLAFTKTAFSYLAIYGESAYTDALVGAVSKLGVTGSTSTTCPDGGGSPTCHAGFGEAVLQNAQSAINLWNRCNPGPCAISGFYDDKTQEQVLEAAVYSTRQVNLSTSPLESVSSSSIDAIDRQLSKFATPAALLNRTSTKYASTFTATANQPTPSSSLGFNSDFDNRILSKRLGDWCL